MKRFLPFFLIGLTSAASAQETPPANAPETFTAPAAAEASSQPQAAAEPPYAAPQGSFDYETVLLQGLNKVTARISKIEAAVGGESQFGNLTIRAEKCWKAAPAEQPENAALLLVVEQKPDEAPRQIFHGWMFSSSPSLAGLEHPVYDLVILGCQTSGKITEKKSSEKKS